MNDLTSEQDNLLSARLIWASFDEYGTTDLKTCLIKLSAIPFPEIPEWLGTKKKVTVKLE